MQKTEFYVDRNYKYIKYIYEWPGTGKEQNRGKCSVAMPGLHEGVFNF